MRSWIVGQQVGNVWKAKYIKERKKVARLWRSLLCYQVPDNGHCDKATSSTPVNLADAELFSILYRGLRWK